MATAFPDVDDTDEEDDEDDEEDEDDEDELAAGVEAAELTVLDAAAVLCAEAGSATAIAAAAAALATPAPAVAAASRRLPHRRVRLALDSSSFSVAITALLFGGRSSVRHPGWPDRIRNACQASQRLL